MAELRGTGWGDRGFYSKGKGTPAWAGLGYGSGFGWVVVR
jgi:hypothetical protein